MKTDYQKIAVEIKNGAAVLRMDNPPVNQMSEDFLGELRQAIKEGQDDAEIKVIVITGTGKNFVAGADVTRLLKVTDREAFVGRLMQIHAWLNSIEQGPKPVIAAINGNCLGGGLEIAMACHYRVAAQGVNVGLPEVKLGLIPGSAGTQRLPRLVGLPTALEMMTTGKFVKAEKASSSGLIDEVAAPDMLMETALGAAAKFVDGRLDYTARMTSRLSDKLPNPGEKKQIMDFAKPRVAAKAKGYIAPSKIIEAVDKGLSDDFQADLAREAELFGDCVVSDVAKNLISAFLAQRAAGKLPRIKGLQPAPVKKVGLLGGGVMGSGIMHLLLEGGFKTVLWEINEQALEKAEAAIRKTFSWKLKNDKIKPEALEGLISGGMIKTTSLDGMADVDLVIEAVLEDMEVKKDIWKKLDRVCRPDTVFGTNTSALPITDMATVLNDPGRMIGLHFFNPAERMPLLEIICAEKTSDQTLATSVAFGRAIRKVPVVVNDGPGFYVSRQLGGMLGGSVFLLADGVSVQAIEEAMTDFGLPMGPATLADLTGLDINYHVNKTFERRLGERYRVHPLTEAIYKLGDYGRKSGRGYFDYSGPQPVPNPRMRELLDNYLKENKVAPRKADKQEIVEVMLALAIDEAAFMMEEGICDRPSDMDLAMVAGTGFPPYRGGVLRYADKWGLPNVYKKLSELEKKYGPRFAPARLIKEKAEQGGAFYQE